ncbi:TraB/GumN family protein [Thermomonas paludicola]|uniref:TraB/GumN family protein n=1 Tax=Thermomonas paludicola TaxID=2884874 RepID=UPI0021146368|nr:TraB/GumN family protein [Thermomonas paludicola]
MPNIAASCTRVSPLPTVAGGLLAALLLALPCVAATAQPVPLETAVQAVRGVSAHAASDAAIAPLQDAPPPTVAPVEPAVDAIAKPGVGIATPLVPVRRERGVLFRVTPPHASSLPAESALGADATGSAPPQLANVTAAPVRDSYLLGTIHFGTPQEQGIDYDVLGKLLVDADSFVNEADVESPWKPEYDAYRWLAPETPLGGMISKDSLQKAQALLPAVRLQDLQRMKPWALLALLEARGESGSDATMDARLQQVARSAGKRLVHLETLEQQLQALDCVPSAEQAQVLEQRLRKSWILRIESAEAMAFYRSRNLDAWLDSIDRMEGLDETARAIEQRSRMCLLEDRNARWIGPLETLFQDGPGFVAVGAVHLVGPDGLIARLRRDGFKVEAVPL